MSSILGATGYIKPVLVITLHNLRDDGSVEYLNYNMDYSTTYEFQVVNEVDGMIYKVRGILKKSISDYCSNNCNSVDYLIIDESTENESKLSRICVKNIRSIIKITDFE